MHEGVPNSENSWRAAQQAELDRKRAKHEDAIREKNFPALVDFYLENAKNAPMQGPYIENILGDLDNSSKDSNPKTNPEFIGYEGFDSEDYLALMTALKKAAIERGLVSE